jgi:hypothetical protein
MRVHLFIFQLLVIAIGCILPVQGYLTSVTNGKITDVSLSGPSTIPKGGTKVTYTLTVDGEYSVIVFKYYYTVYDDDFFWGGDDVLDSGSKLETTRFAIKTVTSTVSFDLWCDEDDYVRGTKGSSGEQEAEVYVNVWNKLFSSMNTNTITVECVDTEAPNLAPTQAPTETEAPSPSPSAAPFSLRSFTPSLTPTLSNEPSKTEMPSIEFPDCGGTCVEEQDDSAYLCLDGSKEIEIQRCCCSEDNDCVFNVGNIFDACNVLECGGVCQEDETNSNCADGGTPFNQRCCCSPVDPSDCKFRVGWPTDVECTFPTCGGSCPSSFEDTSALCVDENNESETQRCCCTLVEDVLECNFLVGLLENTCPKPPTPTPSFPTPAPTTSPSQIPSVSTTPVPTTTPTTIAPAATTPTIAPTIAPTTKKPTILPPFFSYDKCELCVRGEYDPLLAKDALINIPILNWRLNCDQSYYGGQLKWLSPSNCLGVQLIVATGGRCGCEKTRWGDLVGVLGEDAVVVIESDNPNVTAIIVLEGSPVTSDYDIDRVRVFVDEAGFVVAVPEVG